MQLPTNFISQKLTKACKNIAVLALLLVSMQAVADSTIIASNNKQNLNFKASSLCENAELIVSGVSPKVEKLLWKHNNQVIKTSFTPSLIETVAGTLAEGTNNDEFRYPSGIAVDASGNIYIADQFNHRVQKWIPGAKHGITVAGGRGQGDAADQLDYPMGVAIDKEGNLYVTDAANHRVQKFSPNNAYGVTVAGGNGRGNKPNQFSMPFGICLDETGNMYVADNYNHRIQKWIPGAIVGITVAGGNMAGNKASQLKYPSSVKVDAAGNIYVADAANDRVQLWLKDAKEGITVAGGKGRGTAADQLYFPTDIAINNEGDLFIADETNQRIQKWTKGAKQGITVAGGNGLGTGMNQFSYPYGLCIDEQDNLYVADQYNHRVQFIRNPEATVSYAFSLKAIGAGAYNVELIYRDGHAEMLHGVELTAMPLIKPIETTQTYCSGKEYKLNHEINGGTWFVNNNNIASIDNNGVLKALSAGEIIITYQVTSASGCTMATSNSLNIVASPALPAIELAPLLVQQATNSTNFTKQLCAGSSMELNRLPGNGMWSSSDTNIAIVYNNTIFGKQPGTVAVQYAVQENGCTASVETYFTVDPAPQAILIDGYNKVVAGNTIRLYATGSTGQWFTHDSKTINIDKAGYVKGLLPGVAEVHYQSMHSSGCLATGSAKITVQPAAPLVKDAVYNTRKFGSAIAIHQQVTAVPEASLQFYTSASANHAPVEPLIENKTGTQTVWVAQVINGITSQRVPFKVTITAENDFPGTNQGLSITVMGNPVTQFFTVFIKSNETKIPVSMKVVDVQGRVIEQKTQVQANSNVQFGQSYAAGQYFVEYMQGTERKVVQLLKLGSNGKTGTSATAAYTSALY